MVIISYTKKNHKLIVQASIQALKLGKVLAYPTDTSYGLGVDIRNKKALIKLYRIKQRSLKVPIHIVVPSVSYAKKISLWNKQAEKLAKKFWPGPLTLVLALKKRVLNLYELGGKSGSIGLRFPKNKFVQDLVKNLGRPITTPSANPPNHLGGYDSYKVADILKQFQNKKYKPDIIIDDGRLPKRKPSTFVKIVNGHVDILRIGPISETQISQTLKHK